MTELHEIFNTGLSGEILHLILRIIIEIIVFIIGVKLIKIIRNITKKSMEHANVEAGVIQFMDSFLKIALYLILICMIATNLGMDAASIVAVLGSAGVAIGLAIQGSLSNLAGGVLILILKPFKVGDYIIENSGKQEGVVTEIQIFYTKLLTADNKVVILPNGNLANNSLVNISAGKIRRLDVFLQISYDADIKLAKETLMQVISEEDKSLSEKEMCVYVDTLADSGVTLGVRCWVNCSDYWEAKWRITENCKLALDQAKISIPYPQLDLHMKNDI